ncbi:helix-turn-helix domain-containing protein [Shewanella cyperi]|uniref:Helix-turn-helix domain-containing protein n=1 Tax=Shewanella cyperi TaxID=2814292 RepID=A0A975AJW6_9GAMM|nr:helix-turn-helix domain-containing protein [Shewanella cyperi]QSX29116.1 helix-turn-helix domain-containing protein [Shewanella cyperi]
MPKIVLLAMPGCMGGTVHAALDIFYVANACLQRLHGAALAPGARFEVQLTTAGDAPVQTRSGQTLVPDISLTQIAKADVVLISSILAAESGRAEVAEYLARQQHTVAWIRAQAQSGTLMVSACSGSFLLAEAGLLDGREATTHWFLERIFRERYPKVIYNNQKLLLEYEDLICGGAYTAFNDLLLRLVARFAGREVALLCARLLLLDPSRELQQPFHRLLPGRNHGDAEIKAAQEWLAAHYAERITMEQLAEAVAMGSRNFKRRFKAATGETPLEYLQQLRVEAAKQQLEMTARSSNEVIWAVGYEDISSFRRLFKKLTGITMEQYRKRFGLPA